MHDFLRVVAAGAGENRHLAGRFVHEDLDDADALGEGERRVLARRAVRDEEVDAGVDLPAAEPPDAFLVEIAAPGERRDERRADAGELVSSLACPFPALPDSRLPARPVNPAGLKACTTSA